MQAETITVDMAERLSAVFAETFTALVARRDEQYAERTASLDAETQVLREESARIAEEARNLEKISLAKGRMAQAEADKLLLAGKVAAAEAKLEEVRAAENAPGAMTARQSEISDRLAAIETEKRNIARSIFEEWYPAVQAVIRSAEHGLFCVLLDGLRDSFVDFENHNCPARTVKEANSMVRGSHIENLTSDEHSPEWNSGNRWYGRRR